MRLPLLPTNRDLDTCVHQLKVLADSTRFSVIRLLLARPLHVHELAEQLGVEQSLLSHHLRLLREARLVESVRDGKQVLYRVADGVERSFQHAEAIDLGCCQLSFGAAGAPPPVKAAGKRARGTGR